MRRILIAIVLSALGAGTVEAGTIHFPQLAVGNGYSSELIVLNPTTATITGTFSFHHQDGSDWIFNFGSAGNTAQWTVEIPSSGTYRLTLSGGSSLTVGWASFASSVTAAGVATYEHRDGNALTLLVSVQGTEAIQKPTVPVYVSPSENRKTGIAFANPAASTATLRLSLFDDDGELFSYRVDELAAYGQSARYVSELFPSVPAGFQGSLLAEVDGGEGNVAMTGLSQVESLFGGLPVVNFASETSSGSGPQVFILRDGTGVGTVTSNPSILDCINCQGHFPNGTTTVILTAVPREGDVFAGWSSACSGTGTCVLTFPSNCPATTAIVTDPDSSSSLNINDTCKQTVRARFDHVEPEGTTSSGGISGSTSSWRFCDVTCSSCPTGVGSQTTTYNYRYYSSQFSRSTCVDAYNFCVSQRCGRTDLHYYD